ncbi:MAG: DUF4296 domain-containing protein [Cytophagia bacterium]|nr:DUF4296 domain-containing protein [Cytophagia bacterium]NVK83915.1 DUF4296 domain-containing protein [Cytophagia bacterium]
MAKKLFLLTVVLFVFSCGSDEADLPDGILNQGQMVDLMIDIRIAEGMIGTVSMSLDSADAVFKAMERRIFDKHGIDSLSYVNSYNYYLMHPKLYLDVTDIVIDSLKARNTQQYRNNY